MIIRYSSSVQCCYKTEVFTDYYFKGGITELSRPNFNKTLVLVFYLFYNTYRLSDYLVNIGREYK